MKELLELESWANRIVTREAIQDRPLARNQDIQYQASRKYPDRSPEQALNLYVADKMNKQPQQQLNIDIKTTTPIKSPEGNMVFQKSRFQFQLQQLYLLLH